MPPPNESNDPTFPNTNHRSFLVTLSARAIGSLGLGLSILAIGFRWLLPMATVVTPGAADGLKQRTNHRSRHRSALALPARLVVPPTVSPIVADGRSTTSNLHSDKHVYFADAAGSQRSSTSTNEPMLMVTLHDTPVKHFPTEENPSPSNHTLSATVSSWNKLTTMKQSDNSCVESDSSSRRSSLSFHLPKRILSFGNKSRQHHGTSATVTRSLLLYGESKHSRQSNVGFVPPWSSRRKSLDTQSDSNDDTDDRPLVPLKSTNFPSAFNESIRSPAFSCSVKTHHRHVSAPNPRMRTQPYDAPYFALPPTSATFDLRKSPRTFREALINSNMKHVSTHDRGRPVQSSRQSLIKRRSASEGWNNERTVSLL